MAKDTGGPAFPRTELYAAAMEREGVEASYPGMTLLDWFAGQALAGMLASAPVADRSKPNHKKWAVNAYKFADTMITERNKP